jgi:SAM-dependent methyltransferase
MPSPASPIDFGDLRRLQPVDGDFGLGRGRPIDRHYIEGFLAAHAADVRGQALEVAEDRYLRRYGGQRVQGIDVLHVAPVGGAVTVVADLGQPDSLPPSRYDCFVCTQTLQYVFPLQEAVRNIHRALKPGGVLLLSVPGISQISPYDRQHFGEHWRFTPQSVERLLRACFSDVQVQGHGNVLAATAFLQGLACEDLTVAELDARDDRYPMLVTARAVKAGDATA